MKLTVAAAIAAASSAAALVVPDTPVYHEQRPLIDIHSDYNNDQDVSTWWNDILPSADSLASAFDESVDYLTSGFDKAVHVVEDLQEQFHNQLTDAADTVNDFLNGGHDHSDKTIYELIQQSDYTTKFAKLVDEHPKVADILKDTEHNYTLFVPIDEAFKDIPDDHEKPDKETVEKILLYHIGLGEYPAKRILYTHTLPSAYDEKFLGGEPQRLRTSVGLGGVRVNFYSKVVAVDIGAKNGVIHGVRSILAPPPMIGRILSLFPSGFSTLLLAYEKTDFVKFIHGIKMTGTTAFAPGNSAFARLGPRVNAFLFNTETGLKYLKAILKYHVVPNATLYSDAFYDKRDHDKDDVESMSEHFDFTTLLDDAHVSVDIATLGGFRSIRVNGFSHVSIQDGIGKNGVIQVLDKVLIPPHKHKHEHKDSVDEEMSVEELMERLDGYVE